MTLSVDHTAATQATRHQRQLLTIERWVLLSGLVVLPLAYGPKIFMNFSNVPKLTVLGFVVAVAGAIQVVRLLLTHPVDRAPISIASPALAMAGAFVLSWAFTDYPSWSLLGRYTRFGGLLPYLATIAFSLLLVRAFHGSPKPIVLASVAGASGVGLFALIQMVFLGATIAVQSDTAYVTSTMGHSNFAGGFLAVALPLSVGLWLDSDGFRSRIATISTILIASGLLFTVSQGGWAAGVIGLGVLLGLRAGRRRSKWRWPALLLAAGTAVTMVSSVAITMPLEHPFSRVPGLLGTAVSRGFLWETAIKMAAERPLTGWGPNVFAIEGPLHRELEDALLLNFTIGDDPHSVPIAMLVNLGPVGAAAFLYVFLWTVRKWRGRPNASVIDDAVIAAIAAYGGQALVSIDEPALRFSFWTLVACVGCNATSLRSTARRWAPPRRRTLIALTATTVLIGGLAATSVIRYLTVPDLLAASGIQAFGRGDPAEARADFSRAIRLRDEHAYRRRYAAGLAAVAIDLGNRGESVMREFHRTLSFLEDFPDPEALAFYAERLLRWSLVDPLERERALSLLTRARQLDPNNPFLAVLAADTRLLMDQPRAARQELEGFAEVLTHRFPEYNHLYSDVWTTLAIAQATEGDIASGRASLEKATGTGSCRYLVASHWVATDREVGGLAGLQFLCPPTLLRLLPDEAT